MSYMLRRLVINHDEVYFTYAKENVHGEWRTPNSGVLHGEWRTPEEVMHWVKYSVAREDNNTKPFPMDSIWGGIVPNPTIPYTSHWIARKIHREATVHGIRVDIIATGLSKSQAEAAKMAAIEMAKLDHCTVLNKKTGLNTGAPLTVNLPVVKTLPDQETEIFEVTAYPNTDGFNIPAKIVRKLSLEDGMEISSIIQTPDGKFPFQIVLGSGCEVQFTKTNRELKNHINRGDPLRIILAV